MKVASVSELKAHLSRYLKSVRQGEKILVTDRNEPVAQMGPPPPSASAWERLASEGKVVLGFQSWEDLTVTPLPDVPIQQLLLEVRED